uniref:TonB-dependent receptor plug domain-containing protein n=1 Tax=Ningiella ruwaisensis TaxID=2364274 RepID=UPI001447E0CE|nr:TonB-dependent receptor plug domain-containing protein [Ningiella ruwaisensis]
MLILSSSVNSAEESCEDGVCTSRYERSFFNAYAPITALDLIENLPGFSLDNGNQSSRGFSGAAGNILIDGVRISSKSESPSDQLGAIPAQSVLAIEVLRGNLAKFDLPNQSVVANIIRRDDMAGAGTAELSLRQFQPSSRIKPQLELNYSSSISKLEYTANLLLAEYENIIDRTEELTNTQGELIEFRDERFREEGDEYAISLNANIELWQTQLNTNLTYDNFDENGGLNSFRTPIKAGENLPFNAFFLDIDVGDSYEIAFDAEHELTQHIDAKLIAINASSDYLGQGGLTRTFANGSSLEDSAFTITEDQSENIMRLEVDYTGFESNRMQFSLEGTVNELKSNFALLSNENGVLVPQDVAGAVTTVKEERIDVQVTNSFSLSDYAIEASIAAEDSTITQTGGFEASRSFFYLKPNVTVSRTFANDGQLQVRLFRTIGQLNFGDFTSSVNLGDDQLVLGNPELEPEKVITFDIRYEQRFSGVGAINLTVFHDEISDVEDLVPLQNNLEVAGNIGDGSRTGIRGNFTLPTDFVGIVDGRIDARFEFQDSDVEDPLTSERRIMSDFEQWEYNVEFRQDLNQYNFAWGLSYFADDFREQYGLDEFSAFGNEYSWSLFTEKRFGEGMKLRLDVQNFNRGGEARIRQVFAGRRGFSDLLFQELRDTEYARRIFLTLSKTF